MFILGRLINDGNHSDPKDKNVLDVQCYPLYSILLALGNPVIHYFSLDIEGAELPVLRVRNTEQLDFFSNVTYSFSDIFDALLNQMSTHFAKSCQKWFEKKSQPMLFQTIPFDKVDIKVLEIEMNHVGEIFPGSERDIKDFLQSKGFKFYKDINIDHVYVKEGYIDSQ